MVNKYCEVLTGEESIKIFFHLAKQLSTQNKIEKCSGEIH